MLNTDGDPEQLIQLVEVVFWFVLRVSKNGCNIIILFYFMNHILLSNFSWLHNVYQSSGRNGLISFLFWFVWEGMSGRWEWYFYVLYYAISKNHRFHHRSFFTFYSIRFDDFRTSREFFLKAMHTRLNRLEHK